VYPLPYFSIPSIHLPPTPSLQKYERYMRCNAAYWAIF
jgi:hypothetical protein